MAITLEKNAKLSLKKSNGSSLKKIKVELRWDAPENTPFDYDADASAFILDKDEKSLDNYKHFCFYNQPKTPAIESSGDNRKGGGDGEDLFIELDKVPSEGKSISIVLTLHEAVKRGQNLSQSKNGSLTLIDMDTDEALAHIKLDQLEEQDISLLFASIKRTENGWDIENISTGFSQSFVDWVHLYKIDLDA